MKILWQLDCIVVQNLTLCKFKVIHMEVLIKKKYVYRSIIKVRSRRDVLDILDYELDSRQLIKSVINFRWRYKHRAN